MTPWVSFETRQINPKLYEYNDEEVYFDDSLIVEEKRLQVYIAMNSMMINVG